MSELDTELYDLVDWDRFGTHLPTIDQSDIGKIKKQYQDVNIQKQQLYNVWINKCPDPSWDDVVTALEKMKNQNTLADKISKKTGEIVHYIIVV